MHEPDSSKNLAEDNDDSHQEASKKSHLLTKLKTKQTLITCGFIALLVAISLLTFITIKRNEKHQQIIQPAVGSDLSVSNYDKQAAQQLTGGNCIGSGSTAIIPPMKLSQIGTIEPYGLMVGGHVTPVDHQYYLGLDPHALRDTYDVMAPMDGTIVSIQHRGNVTNTPQHSVDIPSSDEYRIVIAHSCSFLTYVDLVTSLDDSLKTKLPAGWSPQTSGNNSLNIPVKQGDVIGHIGGQTLDFAVWDLSQKPLPGLLVRAAYDSAEPWKVFTVAPSNYFATNIKAQTLTKYIRTIAPVDGKIDYDQAGKLVGSWFKLGTNGYEGGKNEGKQSYWAGHLAIAPNFIDPTMYVVSLGSYTSQGDAEQFGIISNGPDPTTITAASGLVKYQLVRQEVENANGTIWQGIPSSSIKVVNGTVVKGTLLVQVEAANMLRAEIFPDKVAAQVTGFDESAISYNRGEGATTPTSSTATH